MTSAVAIAVVGAAGAAFGVGISSALRHGVLRRGSERSRARPGAWTVALAGLTLGAAWMAVTATTSGWAGTAVGLVVSLAGIVAAWVDLDVHRIPNLATGGGITLTVLILAIDSATTGEWHRLLRGLAIGGVALTVCWALAHVTSLGLGDVKLAAALALPLGWGGWSALGVALVAAAVASGVTAGILLGSGRGHRTHMALGPSLVLGAITGLVTAAAGA